MIKENKYNFMKNIDEQISDDLTKTEFIYVKKVLLNELLHCSKDKVRKILRNHFPIKINNYLYSESLYKILVDDIQSEAINLIGRELSDEEILSAKKMIECGLNTNIDTVFDTAILESIKINQE